MVLILINKDMFEPSCSGQVNMADEAKPHSSICSTFEVLVMQCAVGCCSGAELGPIC